jgi:hypothetical protein
VASRIDIDVLILAGEDDHFVPIDQVKEYENSLNTNNPRSVAKVNCSSFIITGQGVRFRANATRDDGRFWPAYCDRPFAGAAARAGAAGLAASAFSACGAAVGN